MSNKKKEVGRSLARLSEMVVELIVFEDPLYIQHKDENFPYLFGVELDRGRWSISFMLLSSKDYTVVDRFGLLNNDFYFKYLLDKYGIDLYSEDWIMDPESASTLIERVEHILDKASVIKGMLKELKEDIEEGVANESSQALPES